MHDFTVVIVPELKDPCLPSPCGSNAVCEDRNGAGACICAPGYFGDPYIGCRPECVLNTDCPWDKSCQNNKCRNPCSGACGSNAECRVAHHSPYCTCIYGYTGNPLVACHILVHVPPCKLFFCYIFYFFSQNKKFFGFHLKGVH